MYANLKGELARKNIMNNEVAGALGIHENTFCNKINGKSRFTVEEAFKIKSGFFKAEQLPLEYLFENAECSQDSNVS